MIGTATVAAWFAKPLVKYGAIATGILALVVVVVLYLDGVRRDGKKAGAAEVTTKVQEDAIKKVEDARKDKATTDDKVRNTPLDSVIDGLR